LDKRLKVGEMIVLLLQTMTSLRQLYTMDVEILKRFPTSSSGYVQGPLKKEKN
jgi:hypothetical protein